MPTNVGLVFTATDRTRQAFNSVAERLDDVEDRFENLALGAAAFATAAVSGLVLVTNETAEYAKVLDIAASKLNTTTAELESLRYVAEQTSNVIAEDFDSALQDLSEKVSDAAIYGGSMAEIMDELGVNAGKLNELNAADQFIALSQAMQNANGTGDALRQTMGLFGEGALLETFKLGPDRINEMQREFNSFNITLQETDISNLREYSATITKIKTVISGAGRLIGAELSVPFNIVATEIFKAFTQSGSLEEKIREVTESGILLFADIIDTSGKALQIIATSTDNLGSFGLVGYALLGKKGIFIGAALSAAFDFAKDQYLNLKAFFTNRGIEAAAKNIENAKREISNLEAVIKDGSLQGERLALARNEIAAYRKVIDQNTIELKGKELKLSDLILEKEKEAAKEAERGSNTLGVALENSAKRIREEVAAREKLSELAKEGQDQGVTPPKSVDLSGASLGFSADELKQKAIALREEYESAVEGIVKTLNASPIQEAIDNISTIETAIEIKAIVGEDIPAAREAIAKIKENVQADLDALVFPVHPVFEQNEAEIEGILARAEFLKLTEAETNADIEAQRQAHTDRLKDITGIDNDGGIDGEDPQLAEIERRRQLILQDQASEHQSKINHDQALISLEQQKQDRINQIVESGEHTAQRFRAASLDAQFLSVKKNSADSLAILAKSNRQAFELQKGFAIGEAIINAHRAINQTLAAYPAPLAQILAAAHGAAAFARVKAIKNQSFGGGSDGGGPSVSSGGSPSVGSSNAITTIPETTLAPTQQPKRQLNLSVEGQSYSRDTIQEIVTGLTEFYDDGGETDINIQFGT